MKKLALVIIFTMLAGSAFAQGWNQNNLGIYLDPAGAENCGYGTGQVACYLVGTNLATATVGGFECKITLSGPAFGPLNIAYPTDALNLNNRVDEYSVGYGTPYPTTNGDVVFMTFDLFINDNLSATEMFLSPIYFASIPGTCAYLDGADYNIILPLYNSTGDPFDTTANLPVFTMNGQCVVPTEEASWGDVKSLFR